MRQLNRIPPGDLPNALDELTVKETRAHFADLEAFLRHRSPLIRLGAARALGRSGVGARELTARLKSEQDELVIAEICESLAMLSATDAVGLIKRIAESSEGELARSYAAIAIVELEGNRSLPFLARRAMHEKSRRGRATLASLRTSLGDSTAVIGVLKSLKSRDPYVRARTARLLAERPATTGAEEILEALQAALEIERAVAVQTPLRESIDVMRKAGRRRR